MILPTCPGKIPQTSPDPHKETNSCTNCLWRVRGIFQGYVGEILEVCNCQQRMIIPYATCSQQISVGTMCKKSDHPNYLCQLHQGELLAFGPGFVFPKKQTQPEEVNNKKSANIQFVKMKTFQKYSISICQYIYNHIFIYIQPFRYTNHYKSKDEFSFPLPLPTLSTTQHLHLKIFGICWWVNVLQLRSPRSEPKFFAQGHVVVRYDVFYQSSHQLEFGPFLGRVFLAIRLELTTNNKHTFDTPPEV